MQWRKAVPSVLLAVVVLCALVLRMDALVESYGPYEHPRWLAATQPAFQRAAALITSERWRWRHVDEPYVQGDPHNYIRFAREMRHFYQAHVREPMFVAATRLGIIAAGGADVGVSLASITFSLLTIVATYLLGRHIASPAVGLGAATALAIDRMVIDWSIEGWRDETFACFITLFVWAWLRMAERPSSRRAVLAGVIGAAAGLTRISSITFLVPAWLWFAVGHRKSVNDLRLLAASVGVTLALVAPFVINCAIEMGDPLYALNYHTRFYLDREQNPDQTERSAARYAIEKFDSFPILSADIALRGLTTYPFTNKWNGLNPWHRYLGRILSWLALAGLFGWLWNSSGRLLLLLLFTALVPFMVTWTVRGGAEWRLTLFAYAFYLVAAFWVLDRLVRALRNLYLDWRAFQVWNIPRLRAVQMASVLVVLVAGGVIWAFLMPYFVARESLLAGKPTAIMAGSRERWFFGDGWTEPVVTGNVVARFTTQPLSTITIPLPETRAYDVVFRMDTLNYRNAPQQRVEITLNGMPVGTFDLTWTKTLVPEYRARFPVEAVRAGKNELTFKTENLVEIGRAGRAFRQVPRTQVVGMRLWYVLVTPSGADAGS
jgi:hypothetical protein